MTHTYTFAIMHVSEQTYEEIKRKMLEAGYNHVFHSHHDGPVIDMVGIAIQADPKQQPPQLTAADLDLSSPHA